jgi:two-component system sensor histidine kinase KdpD
MIEASRSVSTRGRSSWGAALKRAIVAEPRGYVVGSLVTAFTTSIAFAAAPHATLAHVMVIYLLGAVLVATRYGVAVSSFTIAASALCFDYFNIPPVFAFALPDVHGILTLGSMLLTAIVVCVLLHRLRHQRTVARTSEARTFALCALSLALSEVEVVEELPRTAAVHLTRMFGPSASLVIRGSHTELEVSSGHDHALARRALESRELAVEETADGILAVQPITRGKELIGLIRVTVAALDPAHEREQRILLEASADRIAVAIDRLSLAAVARRAQIEAEAEHLRNELLSAMSHDLRTPLASILTAGSTLLNPNGHAGAGARRELLETIVDEAERLNRLVTNLLSVTRLESGRVRLNKTPEALDELIYGVLSRLSGRLEGREIEVEVPEELPFVSMDAVLVDQVLVNLIENVLRYTPAGTPLAVRLLVSEREVSLEVADRGPGIASEEREKVFEKFYRGRHAKQKDGGSGLGLTICRAVARAHGGRIQIHGRPGGGTVVEFVLPLALHEIASVTSEWPRNPEVFV